MIIKEEITYNSITQLNDNIAIIIKDIKKEDLMIIINGWTIQYINNMKSHVTTVLNQTVHKPVIIVDRNNFYQIAMPVSRVLIINEGNQSDWLSILASYVVENTRIWKEVRIINLKSHSEIIAMKAISNINWLKLTNDETQIEGRIKISKIGQYYVNVDTSYINCLTNGNIENETLDEQQYLITNKMWNYMMDNITINVANDIYSKISKEKITHEILGNGVLLWKTQQESIYIRVRKRKNKVSGMEFESPIEYYYRYRGKRVEFNLGQKKESAKLKLVKQIKGRFRIIDTIIELFESIIKYIIKTQNAIIDAVIDMIKNFNKKIYEIR